MFISKLVVILSFLIPLSAGAATKLICISATGGSEIHVMNENDGTVRVMMGQIDLVVGAASAAPLLSGAMSKVKSLTLESVGLPKVAFKFDRLSDGEYGRPVFQVTMGIDPEANGKVVAVVVGQCSPETRFGF